MKSITPIIAIVILVMITLAAGGLAFFALKSYQDTAGQTGSEQASHLSTLQNTRIKVERVANGKVYVRNAGTEPLRELSIMVDGTPVTTSGPSSCEPRALCVFEVNELVSCEGACDISIGSAAGSSAPVKADIEEVLPQTPPVYSGWSVNATSGGFGDGVSATVTWDSGISTCTLLGGCYGFSNQSITTQHVGSGEWE